MRVLFIDTFGDALALALRAQETGHDVIHFIGKTSERCRFIAAGLTKVVRDFIPWLTWAELIVLCDNCAHLRGLDAFRRENPKVAVFGPTYEVAQWEHDRLLGQQVLLEHDVPIPVCEEFSSYDKAIDYAKKADRRLVVKPSGKDADKALSYVSKSPEDLIFMLQKWQREKKLKGRFILQDYKEGIELGIGAYIGKHGFAGGWEESFEHKKLMVGDIGPNTGELGSVLRYTAKSKLADLVLKPFEKTLIDAGYTGCINLNCIIDDAGHPWPLEWTPRLGYPETQIQMPLFPDDIEWMRDLVVRGDAPKFKLDIVSTGVALVMHPFPYPSYPLDCVLGFPVFGLDASNQQVAPYMLQKGTQTEFMTAGDYCLVATGQAPGGKESAKKAYEVLKQLHIPGSSMYRNDIGHRVKEALPRLHRHGFTTGLVDQ